MIFVYISVWILVCSAFCFIMLICFFFFSSRRRHTRSKRDWSSDVCSSDLRLKAAGVGSAPVLVALGRDRVVLKELRYPAVPPAEEPNVVRFQALKEISDGADEVVLDYTPLTNGAPEGERRSMAVVVRKDLYNAIQAMCAAANLRLAAVTPKPYAVAAGLYRAFATGATSPPES